MGEPVVKLPAIMSTNKTHARRRVGDGEAGSSKGTGGGSAEPQGETRCEVASTLVKKTRGTRPGPLSSKLVRDLPLPESDDSDTERMVDVEDVDSADGDETSSTSSVDQVTGKRKKRGMPPTTYAGIKKKKREKCRRELLRMRAEKKALEAVLNPKVTPRCTTPEEDIIRHLEGLNREQMAAEMLESINQVAKVAQTSKNLKGTYIKALKTCTKKLRAAATVVGTKVGPDSTTLEETKRWKERVRSLEDQVERLTTLLHEERAARLAAEGKVQREKASGEGMPEAAQDVIEVQHVADHTPRASTRAQTKGKPERMAKQMRPKAQGPKQEAAKREKPEATGRTEDTVYRPMIRGERKVLRDPPAEDAMEGIRRVMEGVSIKDVVSGEPEKVKRNLEDLITRCQGALIRIPKEKGDKEKKLPVITKMEKVRTKVSLRARETAARIVQKTKEVKAPKEQKTREEEKKTPALAKPTTSWTEVVRRGKKKTEGTKQETAVRNGKPEPAAAANKTAEKTAKGKKPPKRRSPKSAAVAITFPEGQAGEGMRFLRSRIKLEDLGIEKVKSRRALNGATLLEIQGGGDAKAKADKLATQIREVG
ncbi:PREDICTED: actin cytoskeleton-regulatory complex protein pan-1-like [Vollenhovia emeryi]|uniref:actin cytoskeleton-regulatory complex protein pan-1-like n=1 Tax=Vollenhovia emeryi TaxID=411798 RepID=UPI0005F3D8D8|nr:PREDICTED: actin cytoskeleton-regulatory complex protein pan-1-like [Vollenhovia emeryi]